MPSPTPGDLVKVGDEGHRRDGIVFETPSALKVVVAVVDPHRGPVFRTVHPDLVVEREAEGPDDATLRRLIRRTPLPAHRAGRSGAAARYGNAGHTRAPTHRPTGR